MQVKRRCAAQTQDAVFPAVRRTPCRQTGISRRRCPSIGWPWYLEPGPATVSHARRRIDPPRRPGTCPAARRAKRLRPAAARARLLRVHRVDGDHGPFVPRRRGADDGGAFPGRGRGRLPGLGHAPGAVARQVDAASGQGRAQGAAAIRACKHRFRGFCFSGAAGRGPKARSVGWIAQPLRNTTPRCARRCSRIARRRTGIITAYRPRRSRQRSAVPTRTARHAARPAPPAGRHVRATSGTATPLAHLPRARAAATSSARDDPSRTFGSATTPPGNDMLTRPACTPGARAPASLQDSIRSPRLRHGACLHRSGFRR
jgi:hypothetical protein